MTDEAKKLARKFLKDELAEQVVALQKNIADMEDAFNKTEADALSLRAELQSIKDKKLVILTDGSSSSTKVIWEGNPVRDLNTVKFFASHKHVNASVQKVVSLAGGEHSRPIINLLGEGYKPAKKNLDAIHPDASTLEKINNMTARVLTDPNQRVVINNKVKASQSSPSKKSVKPTSAKKVAKPITPKQPDAWNCFECGAVNDKSKKKKGKVQCYSCKSWTKEADI